MKLHTITLAFAAMTLVAGCGEEDVNSRYELAAKPEYSVLQSLEYRYRNSENAEGFLVQRNALDTSFDAFALPVKGQKNGYVWFIANPKVPPYVKLMPDDVDFIVSRETVDAIDRAVRLAPDVKGYLIDQSK